MASILKTPYRLLTASEREFRNWIAERKEALRTKMPRAELAFKSIVDGLQERMNNKHLYYERQKEFIANRAIVFFSDFCFERSKLLVEIDGRSHSRKGVKEADEWRTKLIGQSGYRVVRIANKDILGRPAQATECWLIENIAKHSGNELLEQFTEMQWRFPELYEQLVEANEHATTCGQ